MYPVSETFLRAMQENIQKYYWTGKITTKGGVVYPFGYEDICMTWTTARNGF